MLDLENPKLKDLYAGDLIWVSEMEFDTAPAVALTLRALPTPSETPADDFERLLDVSLEDFRPYSVLVAEQGADRGEGEYNPATGFYVYMLAHPVGDLDCVRVRPPKMRDLVGIDMAAVQGDFQCLARLSGVPMDTLKRFRLGDFQALQEALQRFLQGTFPRPTD